MTDVNDLDLSKIFVVEYSRSQDAYHVDPLSKTLDDNLNMFKLQRSNDYQILALCNSRDEGDAIIQILKNRAWESDTPSS